jgi:hypothetical protein
MGEMRPARLAPFLIPAAILAGESLTLGQPDTDLGLGLALLIAFALAFLGIISVLQRD